MAAAAAVAGPANSFEVCGSPEELIVDHPILGEGGPLELRIDSVLIHRLTDFAASLELFLKLSCNVVSSIQIRRATVLSTLGGRSEKLPSTLETIHLPRDQVVTLYQGKGGKSISWSSIFTHFCPLYLGWQRVTDTASSNLVFDLLSEPTRSRPVVTELVAEF